MTWYVRVYVMKKPTQVNYHIIRKEFGQALLLAGPGVVISALLTSIVPHWLYGWRWDESMMFGSIVKKFIGSLKHLDKDKSNKRMNIFFYCMLRQLFYVFIDFFFFLVLFFQGECH